MSKSFIRGGSSLRLPTSLYRLETGFSMLEAVVVVGVLLALAVGGFFAYGPITENAKKAKVRSAASEVHTAALVASFDGDPATNSQDVINKWNGSTDKIRVEILPQAEGANATDDLCVSATDIKNTQITAKAGDCSDASASSNPEVEAPVVPTPTPTPTPTVVAPPTDVNATGGTIVASTTYASWYTNRTAYSKTSTESYFGFKISEATTDAQQANFKIEFSGGENVGINPTSLTAQKTSSGDRPWYVIAAPTAEGYKTGTGYITAKATNLTTNAVSYKTWTLTVQENTGIAQSQTYSSWWADGTAYSKTSTEPYFGFQILGAKQSDYTVVFSGGDNINVAATQTTNFTSSSSNGYRSDWYAAIKPDPEGFVTGTGTITATATHKGTGTVFTKTWTLTVQENTGIAKSQTYGSWWADGIAYSRTSTEPYFGFQILGAKQSDYTVVFSGGDNINVAAVQTTNFTSSSSNGYRADWYAAIKPDAEGFVTGTGTITATATHKGTGTVFTKTWALTVNESTGIAKSQTYGSWWADGTAYSKTSTEPYFGFQILGAKQSDYTVVFSGGDNINVAATQTTNFTSSSSNGYRADWYAAIKPDPEGFVAGTGTITATATHNGTGTVLTKTWTLTVNENTGVVQSQTYGSWWGDRTVTAGSSTESYFGFQINGAKQSDYTVAISGGSEINAAVTAVNFTSSSSNGYRADWYTTVKPGAGGFTKGASTITATVTHKGTGTVFTKTWTVTVP